MAKQGERPWRSRPVVLACGPLLFVLGDAMLDKKSRLNDAIHHRDVKRLGRRYAMGIPGKYHTGQSKHWINEGD
jgi:hypothetical protein